MCSTLAVKLKVTFGVRRVQRARDAQRVRRSVEKIGIAEVDVARAGRDLRARVLQHDLRRDGEEMPAVDGRDRTVPAQVLAAARRLDVARDAPFARDRQPRVLRERGQRAAVGHQRRPAARRARSDGDRGARGDSTPRQLDELRLAIGAEDAVGASAASSARFSVA